LKADYRALIDLAGSVADGAPVDWTDAESRADAASRRLVRHLRLVESISALHKSMPDDGVVSDLAGSIADGAAVDWQTAESRASVTERRLLRHLRLVESISSLHRTAADTEDGGDEARPLSRATEAEPAGPRWGRLVLLEPIGRGASSEVFRAWDSTLHQEVALKLLHDEGKLAGTRERLLDEARRLARVRHRHVVHVYGADEHDGRVGLWMELVRGESLEQIVKTRGPFGDREAAMIGLDLCAALAAVHGAGLLHRDVKAQNVMRESGGRIVLMDFGTGEELAGTNRLVGTPLYLAPEIFRGDKASVQSDLYSVGVLLFYLVTGQFPVTAASMDHLGRAHERGDRRPLRDARPDLPEGFVRVIEHALHRDPARRYRSAGELEAALRESVAPLSQPEVRVAPPRPVRMRPSILFATAAVALLAIVVALIVWTRTPVSTSINARRVAVLPLTSRSATVSSELSEAITEELIATMAQVESLRTTSLDSILPFKGSSRARTQIAQQLGVDAVLDGVLSATDDPSGGPGELRLDAKLIAAGTGIPLWSGGVSRKRGEAGALLSEIARHVTEAMRVPVTAAESVRLGQVHRTDPQAEEAYLQGRLHLTRYGQQATDSALKSFLRATEIDPAYAAAHGSAAFAYVKLAGFGGISYGEARTLARNEIRRAEATGEETAEAHAAEAHLKLLYEWDWQAAEREFQKSLAINPGFVAARNVYAQLLAAEHRFDESLHLSQETLRIDPQSIEALINHGTVLYYKHDFEQAEDVSRRALAMDAGNENALMFRARVLEAQERYDDALALATEAQRLTGDGNVTGRMVIIRLLALSGRMDESRAATVALEQAGRKGTLRVRPRDLGFIYLAQGRINDSLDQFERALDERDPSLVWLTIMPRVDPLRDNPRFGAILQRVGP
jgi:serine/threonine protein kinase/tetratricopeptide (TPR) repeat protein